MKKLIGSLIVFVATFMLIGIVLAIGVGYGYAGTLSSGGLDYGLEFVFNGFGSIGLFLIGLAVFGAYCAALYWLAKEDNRAGVVILGGLGAIFGAWVLNKLFSGGDFAAGPFVVAVIIAALYTLFVVLVLSSTSRTGFITKVKKIATWGKKNPEPTATPAPAAHPHH